MRRKNSSSRSFSPFNLSFLDIMSCGLGAVILIFLILKHGDIISPDQTKLLEKNIYDIESSIAKTSTDIDSKQGSIAILQSKILQQNETIDDALNILDAKKTLKNSLIEENKKIQQNSNKIENFLPDIISKSGDGERQYLTGLKIEGKRIVYLLDTSASMLDENVQKIFRLSFMSDQQKNSSHKWKRAKSILTWLVARLPQDSQFTILTFNEVVTFHSLETWADAGNPSDVSNALDSALQEIPQNGTNLEKALIAIKRMNPHTDGVYIITDGLPTIGEPLSKLSTALKTRDCLKPRGRITSQCRHVIFEKAKEKYLNGKIIKTSTILLPLQGDQRAASDYWNLALQSGGMTISPSRDWP
jgi:hypothetical protein